MELVTTHTHTGFTNHGHGTVAELVGAASDAGVSTIAVTEHYPLSREVDPANYVSMAPERIGEYCADIARAAERHPGIEVICGCELDWLGEQEDRSLEAADLAMFSLVLGSVHFIDGWPFDDPAQRGFWDEAGADYIWNRYVDIWCQAVTESSFFHVMAHPDLAKKFAIYPSFDLQPLYDRMAEACASSGRMIEVNTSGATYACKEMFPARGLLESFRRAGVPCTVGTDAHDPAHVARGIRDAYRLMHEAGYRTVTVPTKDGDRRQIPLG